MCHVICGNRYYFARCQQQKECQITSNSEGRPGFSPFAHMQALAVVGARGTTGSTSRERFSSPV